MQNIVMKSCLHDTGHIECAFFEQPVVEPKAHEVVIQVEAAPVNPSDLGLMIGAADAQSAEQGERNGRSSIVIALPPAMVRAMGNRIGQWLPVGNEGCGTVIQAGDSPEAQALLGRRVGVFGGELFARYRTVAAQACLPLPDGTPPASGASCFVNPMTALGMLETLKMEGHTALVHTAAASNLGQMLNRLCLADGIPLVNIVRSDAQAALLTEQSAQSVLNSSADDFAGQLAQAVDDTGATLAFDAIGGGKLVAQILGAMEAAAVKRMPEYSRYGSAVLKQAYIYGALDMSPTILSRGFGFSWSVSGWLLPNFLQRAGMERVRAMQQRVVAELETSFASHYSATETLTDALNLDVFKRYARFATGNKTLLTVAESS
jgi:NADPH2:quinone reductase